MNTSLGLVTHHPDSPAYLLVIYSCMPPTTVRLFRSFLQPQISHIRPALDAPPILHLIHT